MLQDVLAALRAGDHASALTLATTWLQSEPENAEAHLAQAHALAASKDMSAAAAAVDRAIELAPDRSDLLTLRAYLDMQSRDLVKAAEGLSAALAQNPNQLPAYVALAHLALLRGDRAEAEKHVAFARRIDELHPRLLLLEAQLAGIQGRPDAVLPLMKTAVERAPNDPLVQASFGLALMERGHFAFAEQALRNALALSSASPALRAALVASVEAQGQFEGALQEAEAWVAAAPNAATSRWCRGRLLAQAGRFDDALADLEVVHEQVPRHAAALDLAVQLCGQQGGPQAIFEALRAHIRTDPEWVLPWRRLLSFVAVEQVPEIVALWREAAPKNPHALETAALLAERQGQEGEALALAAEALSIEPRLVDARLLQARACGYLEPAAAVDRMNTLVAATVTPAQARALRGWQGVALHRAERAEEALDAWRRLWEDGPPIGSALPQPVAGDAARVTDDGGAGRLLWGPPASRIERVQSLVHPLLGDRLLLDRGQAQTLRNDGFNAFRTLPDHPEAGSTSRWRAPLEAAGYRIQDVVDCLPFWDGWTQAILHGTTLIAVLRDPRDMLLNWMARGSAAGFGFPGPEIASAWLALQLDHLLDLEARAPKSVIRIDADALDRDPAAFAASVQAAFGLDESPDLARTASVGQHPNGLPIDFPAGAWRAYSGLLAGPFAALADVAVRLGYPAE